MHLHNFFKTGKQIKRLGIPNDSFAFTAVALQRTKNHITTETRALKHIKPVVDTGTGTDFLLSRKGNWSFLE